VQCDDQEEKKRRTFKQTVIVLFAKWCKWYKTSAVCVILINYVFNQTNKRNVLHNQQKTSLAVSFFFLHFTFLVLIFFLSILWFFLSFPIRFTLRFSLFSLFLLSFCINFIFREAFFSSYNQNQTNTKN